MWSAQHWLQTVASPFSRIEDELYFEPPQLKQSKVYSSNYAKCAMTG